MLYKDTGIVIKQIEYSDYDRILTIVTKRHGKISAFAKGVRRLTSKRSASTDLFVKSRFSFAEGRNLDIVTETVIEDSYDYSKNAFDKISNLFYLSQVLDQLVVEGDVMQSEEIFFLLDRTLGLLKDVVDDSVAIRVLLAAFELKLLTILGLLPSFYECVKCGKSFRESNVFLFRPSVGGILCESCFDSDIGNISKRAIKSLRYLSENPIEKSLLLNCDRSTIKKLDLFNKGMLQYFAELELQ